MSGKLEPEFELVTPLFPVVKLPVTAYCKDRVTSPAVGVLKLLQSRDGVAALAVWQILVSRIVKLT